MNNLDRLQRWYLAQCNGDWEHGYGLSIGTIDNPGWKVRVHIAHTPLAGRPLEKVNLDLDEQEWMVCEVKNGEFIGYGGPLMLDRIIGAFLDWAHEAG